MFVVVCMIKVIMELWHFIILHLFITFQDYSVIETKNIRDDNIGSAAETLLRITSFITVSLRDYILSDSSDIGSDQKTM